ncbi:WS/DGAT/MGAT family O-acyltransferase [Streptosporangium sp. NBC_01756]|uniref:WS/DGAT/MGAT family O-acyltransferase n=1 Tax=Streptosporangium sp. NBC_01756 TaxID=2975950 RepID=UPI002DDC6C43|nr:wax ester/triacylglycerol synthase family O-acyltransferase [Streptosporangium sp. NBC_01756]WSC87452.1 wax ester/triacylglycerol synthase family O-acyltransferase [Streptosporangium sp. NBC_01756]
MRQLTALDAQFLHAESATTAAHVAGVAILDPAWAPSGVVTREALIGLMRERLHLTPALSLRLAGVPFGLDHPYWTEVPGLDVADHIYETILPLPGDEAQLAEVIARIHERRLDRARPLWEMHLIQGLTGGRAALYAKVHHCAIDGVSGADALAALLDLTPEPRVVDPPAPAEATTAPGPAAMFASAVTRSVTHPARALRSLVRMAADLDVIPVAAALPGARAMAAATRTIWRDTEQAPEMPSLAVPYTPFNGPISAERRFSYGSIPLSDVKRIAKTFGISVNDVVMTLCASALRSWLRECDALPDQPLIAAVPVAVRTGDAQDTVGNRLSVMITPMPTDLASPLDRLRVMGQTMRTAKRRFAGSPATWLNELSAVLPAAVTALATPAVFRLASIVLPPINLIISNVPGPQLPLYLCGARVLGYHPMSVLTDLSGGVNITCFSYDGSLDFGILACPGRVKDVWRLMGHLQEAMEELTELAAPAPSREARETVGV